MSSLSVTVEPANGRDPRRVVTFMLGDKTHTDTCDPLDGFQRQKLLDRAASKLGVKRC